MIVRRCCLFLSLFGLAGCGLDPAGTRFFELTGTYPAAGQADVDPLGRYYAVFNAPVSYADGDDVAMSFPGRITANAETLFFERTDPLPPYGRSDWFAVRTLTPSGGSRERFDRTVSFTVAAGEQEDNNALASADTLRPGGVLTGTTDKAGAPLDMDYFVCTRDSQSAITLVVERIGPVPLFVVTLPGNRVYPLEALSSVRFEAADTVDFAPSGPRILLITNKSLTGGPPYPPNGWYRIRSIRS